MISTVTGIGSTEDMEMADLWCVVCGRRRTMPGILLVCESNIFGEKMRKHKVCGPWNQGLRGSGMATVYALCFMLLFLLKR